MADRVLGVGYFPRPSEIAQDPQTCFYICVTSEEDVIGFVFGRVLAQHGLQEYLEHRIQDIPVNLAAADASGALGVIQTVAVAPEHWGKGIGTKLLRIVHDAIVGRGGDKLIVTFKRGPRDPRVDGVMNKLGFEQWVKLETYWKDRCEQGDFDCVHRKNGCSCEAIFYRKAVY